MTNRSRDAYRLAASTIRAISAFNRSVIDEKNHQCLPILWGRCKLKLVVENNKIIRAEAAEGVTNQNQLCLKGYYGWDFLNDTRLLTPRLTRPMIRYEKGGKFTPLAGMKPFVTPLNAYLKSKIPMASRHHDHCSSEAPGMKPTM